MDGVADRLIKKHRTDRADVAVSTSSRQPQHRRSLLLVQRLHAFLWRHRHEQPIVALHSHRSARTIALQQLGKRQPNLNATAGINQVSNSIVNIYPNPVTQFAVISNLNSVNSIEVTNVLGEKMNAVFTRITSTDIKINTSDFASGIYFITAIDSNGKVLKGKFNAKLFGSIGLIRQMKDNVIKSYILAISFLFCFSRIYCPFL